MSVLMSKSPRRQQPRWRVVAVSDRTEGGLIEFNQIGRLFPAAGILDGLADDSAAIVEKDGAVVHGEA